jgi:hypothetical protein
LPLIARDAKHNTALASHKFVLTQRRDVHREHCHRSALATASANNADQFLNTSQQLAFAAS